jgi:beta-galactosidase
MEFEAGAGDYGSSFDGRNEPADTDFKIRISLAQGNRLLNYYLFTGGINERMERQYHDGNDRISFTGERHGTGAPVNPEGERSYTFPRLARANTAALAIGDKLATMEEEHDAFDLAFIPDYWMTEYRYPGTPQIQEMVDALRMTRFGGPNRITARSLLLNSYRFGAIDLQRADALAPGRTLVVNAGLAMAPEIQQRLVDHVSNGAGVFIHGQLPRFDMTGSPCTILIDALGLEYRTMRHQTHRFYLSIASRGIAAPRAELSIGWAQTFAADDRAIFTVYDTDEACGFDIPLGGGRMIVVTSTLPGELDFFHRVMRELGVTRGLTHDVAHHGIFLTSQRNDDGERLIHLLNLDAFDKAPVITDGGVPFAEGRPVTLRSRDGVMLPVEMMAAPGVEIAWSTAEIARRDDDGITLRIEGPSALLIRTDREIAASGATIDRRADGSLLVTSESAGALRVLWD